MMAAVKVEEVQLTAHASAFGPLQEGKSEYDNAKWWFSSVSHPQLSALYPAKSLTGSRTLAKDRVDAVEACVVSGRGDEERLKEIVWDVRKARCISPTVLDDGQLITLSAFHRKSKR